MIVNLTQHAPTAEQAVQGVTQPLPGVAALLTFTGVPTHALILARAAALADAAVAGGAECMHAMIGGAPYLMAPLEAALWDRGITPVYACSDRVSVEQVQPDGSVRKSAEFRHLGFVEAVL